MIGTFNKEKVLVGASSEYCENLREVSFDRALLSVLESDCFSARAVRHVGDDRSGDLREGGHHLRGVHLQRLQRRPLRGLLPAPGPGGHT